MKLVKDAPNNILENMIGYPDLTQNTKGRYIPILLIVVIMLTTTGHKP